MFYYLLNKSSIFKNEYNDKAKFIGIILSGSFIYIIIHAFISFTKSIFLNKLKIYFWIILFLDIIINILNKDNIVIDNNNSKTNIINKLFDLKTKINDIFNTSQIDNKSVITNIKDKFENKTKDTRDTIDTKDTRDTRDTINTRDTRDTKDSRDTRDIIDIIDINEKNIDINKTDKIVLSTPISCILKPENIKKLETNEYLNNNDGDSDSESDAGSEMDFNINDFSSSL